MLTLAWALFVVSVLGVLTAAGIFFWHDTDFWQNFDAGPVLRIGTALAAALAASSGLLFYHHRRQESYTTFAEIVFAFFLFVSLVNFLWMAPVLFFL